MASKFATPADLAEWLQVSEERLRKLRQNGQGPQFVKVGRSVRYLWADVHAWTLAQRSENTRATR